MSRLSSRLLAAVGAGAFAVALTVGGAGSAVAAPTSGQVETMQDLKGGWLTPLTGFREGSPVSWQHRMIVRKVLGSAAVAWEQWRDCADYAVACKAGKATGDGWSAPSRVLMVMDSNGVVHGVGATGTLLLTPDEEGLSAVMLSHGQQGSGAATSNPTTSAQSRTRPSLYPPTPLPGPPMDGAYAATGPTVNAATGAFTYTPTQIVTPIPVT
jgi:uncharacterized oligopeptide transporter (OPT) family protein